MKIILASKYGPHGKRKIGGVQSWVATVADCLERLGHTVTLCESGEEPRGVYDLGIMANPLHHRKAWTKCGKMLQVSHGIIDEERPVLEHVAFTSEGVRDHWGVDGPIVRQPIDLKFWRHDTDFGRSFLTRFSYRKGLPFVAEIAHQMGLTYWHLSNKPPRDVRDILSRSVCVLATGRAALEAMACGAPVVICDHRSAYQGPLLDLDAFGAMRQNYSGRGGIVPTPENVGAAIQAAINYGSARAHVERHHDAEKVTAQLLGIVS